MDIKKKIRSVKDWPKKGVTFRDITTLLSDGEAFKKTCDLFYDRYKEIKIDKVVGIDARGFILGSVLAYKLGVGFVPIRKKGKLPPETYTVNYSLEYNSGSVEIGKYSISAGERVLIIDDLMATGGTIEAAVKLVEKLGGEIIECAFMIELTDLKGRDRLGSHNIFCLTSFTEDEA